uniref:Uncharacterized protein n=1 Tax=Micrurus lemniscatus lemniscatus TaxID=129467 RepID=A0A2D4H9A3_MICLE
MTWRTENLPRRKAEKLQGDKTAKPMEGRLSHSFPDLQSTHSLPFDPRPSKTYSGLLESMSCHWKSSLLSHVRLIMVGFLGLLPEVNRDKRLQRYIFIYWIYIPLPTACSLE